MFWISSLINEITVHYRCQCEDGWSGEFCHVEEEVDCEDGVDNDNSKFRYLF